MFTPNQTLEIGSLLTALQNSRKGQLKYDSNWKDEGRTKEIVDSIKENLTCLRLTPRFRQLGPLLIQEQQQQSGSCSRSSSTSPPLLISVPQPDVVTSNSLLDDDSSIITIINGSNSIMIDDCDLQDYRTESELREYESKRRELTMKRFSESASKLIEQKKLLNRSLTDELKTIDKEYEQRGLDYQRRHQEQLRLQEQEDLIELQNSAKNFSSIRSRISRDSKLRNKSLSEINDDDDEKSEELKLQQNDLRSKITNCRNTIQQIFEECSLFIVGIQKLLPSGTSMAINELEQYRKSLTPLITELDQLLSSATSLNTDHLKLAENNRLEAIQIKTRLQLFFGQMQKVSAQIALQKKASTTSPVTMASSGVVPKTTSVPVQKSLPSSKKSPKIESPHELYTRWQTELIQFEQQCQHFLENPNLKEKKINLNVFVRATINKICNLSVEHLKSQLQKLLHLFEGKAVNTKERGGSRIVCSKQDYSLHFAINCASKGFILAAFQNKSIAMQLAPVIAILWSFHPEFGHIFMCQLSKSCPYVIPYHPVRTEQESEIEYVEKCGYQRGKNGQLESDEMFYSRMYRLIELYSAVVQCNLPADSHPQDLQHGWRWLATVLDSPPRDTITSLMLEAFLSISAHKLHAVYGRQFVKLVKFIYDIYLPKLEKITKPDDRQTFMKFKSMMDLFVKTLFRATNRTLPPPDGLVPNYFFAKSYIYSTR